MDQDEFTVHVTRVLERIEVEHIVVGSLAAMYYGEFRTTQDVDIVARVRVEHVSRLVGAFPPDEYYLSEDAALEVAKRGGQFNIIHSASALKADVYKSRGSAYDDLQFARSRAIRFPSGDHVRLASPEDVIVMKLIFYDEGKSDKHLRDIAGMVRTQGAALDHAYIELWADRFAVLGHWLSAKRTGENDDRRTK